MMLLDITYLTDVATQMASFTSHVGSHVASLVGGHVARHTVISDPVTRLTLVGHPFAQGGLGGTGQVRAISNVCAQAPSAQVATFGDQLIGWIKWGVLYTIIGVGFLSVALMIGGKVSQSGRAAQMGSSALFFAVLGAIAFACIYGILISIVGNGC